jgi:mannose-6-phosphate isomerase-like protein (cupin superfamily)
VSDAPASGGLTPVTIVPKPWGHEVIWAHTDKYVGKILHINAGQALSVQYHHQKDETVYLLRGRLKYRVGEAKDLTPNEAPVLREFEMKEGQSFRNTPGTIHQMEAITDCDMLEASTPFLDDVVRLSDRYGRQGTSAP